MDQKQVELLACAALEARNNAYAPYSGFNVGAAVMTSEDEIFTGCNIENGAYPAGICAERTAIFSAAAKGRRHFKALAVTGGKAGEEPSDFCMPCGICRQVISEFCGPEFEIYVVKSREEIRLFHLKELLPYAFDKP